MDRRLRELERRALSGDEVDVKVYGRAYCTVHRCSIVEISGVDYTYLPISKSHKLYIRLAGEESERVLNIQDKDLYRLGPEGSWAKIQRLILDFCVKELAVCPKCKEHNDLTMDYFKTIVDYIQTGETNVNQTN